MYETVKTVKGHDIYRMKGMRGHYYVNIRENDAKGWKEFHCFKTIKAAAEFIERTF